MKKRTFLFLTVAFAALMTLGAFALNPLKPAADDVVNPELSLASATPEFGSQVETLSTITLTWNYNSKAWRTIIADEYAPDMYDPEKNYKKLEVTRNGNVVSTLTPSLSNIAYTTPRSATLTLTLDTPVSAEGVYTIVIPEGYILDSDSPTPNTNGKTTLKYRIGNAEEEGGTDPDPVDPDDPDPVNPDDPAAGTLHLDSTLPDLGGDLEAFSNVSTKWLDGKNNPCVYDGPAELDLFGNINNEQVRVGKLCVSNADDNIVFTLNHELSVTGTYTFTIPAGAVKSQDGSESNAEEQTLTASINYAANLSPSSYYPSPYTTLDYKLGKQLGNFAVTYQDNITVNPDLKPYLIDPKGNIIMASGWFVPGMSKKQGTVNFENSSSFDGGRYVFILPRNAVEGSAGAAFYVDYIAMDKPNEEVVPDDLELKVTKCTVGEYDLLDPNNGMPWLGNKDRITIATNIDYACDGLYYKVVDVTDCTDGDYTKGQTIYSNYIETSNPFTGLIPNAGSSARRLSKGKFYCVEVLMFQNYKKADFRKQYGPFWTEPFEGGCEPFIYADINVTRVEPAPGGNLAPGGTLTMTFQAPVTYIADRSGIPMGQQGILRPAASSNDEKTVWTFVIPQNDDLGSGTYEIHLAFEDPATGHKVRPTALNVPETDVTIPIRNWGSENNTTISLTYHNENAGLGYSVEPAPGKVDSLTKFRFTADNQEINPSWLGQEAVVRDASGYVVATLICDGFKEDGGTVEMEYDSSDMNAKSIAVNQILDKEVTAAGEYTLELPYAYFSVGREKESDYTKPMTFAYTVSGIGVGVEEISAKAPYFIVYNLQGMEILKKADASALRTLAPGLYIVNGKKVLVK